MDKWNTRAKMSRTERQGIILLLVLIFILIVFQDPVAELWVQETPLPELGKFDSLIDRIEAAQLVEKQRYGQNSSQKYPATGYSNSYLVTSKKSKIIEVNSATATDFESLYGIGKVLSARIVKFRDGLGGFQSVDQIRDVYGIRDSIFEDIRKNLTIKPVPVRLININTADLETLSEHPYIPPTLAKQFVGYRSKVRSFESVEDIKNLYYLRDHPELYEKLSPYLTVN